MDEKIQKNIERLEKINDAARAQIVTMRANHANERGVKNAIRGLRYREAEIARLKETV